MASDVSEAQHENPARADRSGVRRPARRRGPLDDPAELEHLAATLVLALEQPEVPEEVASAVLAAIEARRDADAAGVLTALGVIAAPPLAARGHAGAERLAREGIISRGAIGVGTLAVDDVVPTEGAGAELLVALRGGPARRTPRRRYSRSSTSTSTRTPAARSSSARSCRRRRSPRRAT